MGIESNELKISKAGWTAPLLLTLACMQSAWPSITLTLQDAKSNPIAGVSCAQNGGAPAVSDPTGKLVITNVTAINPSSQPSKRAEGNNSLSRIPLASGEKAVVDVINTKGENIFHRTLARGDRAEFPQGDRGVYFVQISTSHYSTRGRFANLGKGMVFEGIEGQSAPSSAPMLAKTGAAAASAAVSGSIICSKTGYNTQVYQLADGSNTTIDFSKITLLPLFNSETELQPDVVVETDTAIITRYADRARDRHAREDEFHLYDHYLSDYWLHRTAQIEIVDKVAKGGTEILVNVTTQWRLESTNCRAFYRGIGTVAEYHSNQNMDRDPNNPLKYHTVFKGNPKENFRPIQKGDRMEIEVSQFLDKVPEGRNNYYGTVVLYIVGSGGLVPWESHGVFGDATTEREDSYPIAQEGWEGGRVTLPYNESNEPNNHFIQMAPNLAPRNGQVFVWGRRLHHTDMITGKHDEPDNPVWDEMVGKAGVNYVSSSCTACHVGNGRGLPPAAVGSPLYNYVVKVGDANGDPHPLLGRVLQPHATAGAAEGYVTLASWTEANGLRSPNYSFAGGPVPAQFSARVTPQLVGMGLLEAVPETEIQALADPDDLNGDGISGRVHIVKDLETGEPRLGRFGWKAGKARVAHQVAGAFNTDMGVMTSILPNPDCGSAQTNCGASGSEVADTAFRNLVDYISLLGVSARRDLKDPAALRGEALFTSIGCAACHTTTLTTSAFHPKAELRNQTIHPYTDLLLHDMGPGLADNLAEEGATGAEWRTAPLWNIGLTAGVSGGEGYLHDGRARTLSEAILWHGGEGTGAMNKFKALPTADSDALIKFLKSL